MRLTGPAALAVMAFVIGACDARPPLAVAMDAGADREMRSRIPTCQPGIRETACTSAADAHPPDAEGDARGDAAVRGLDAGDGALPDAGAATDARGVDGAVDGAAACRPTSGGSGDFRLVDIQPHQVMAHASVTFTINYEGELPSPQALWLRMGNQVLHINPTTVDTTSSSFKISFYVDPPAGARRVDALVGNLPPSLAVVAWLDCALQVATWPAKPVLVPPSSDTDTLGIPVHPELVHVCARSAIFGVSNQGDELVTVRSVALTGSPAFAIADDQCTNRSLAYDADLSTPCSVKICFTDTTPGDEAASLTFHTSAGDLKTDFASSVLPATEGLDRSFTGSGALLLPLSEWSQVHVIRGATLLNNGMSVAMWDQFYGLLVVSSDGQPWSPPIGLPTTGDSCPLNWISAVRAGGPGQGIYALVSPSGATNIGAVVRFFDDGTSDAAFAGSGALVLDGFLSAQYGGIEIQPSGRVLVIGAIYPLYGVRAFRPSGEEDLAYRTSLIPLADFNHGAIRAIDDGGRLYVATTTGVVRLGPDGGIDPGFSFSPSVEALAVDRDQHLLAAGSGKLWRLDEGGAASAIPLAPQPELGARLFGIAVDTRGRILLTSSTGAVLRYLADGTFDGRVGFAEGGAQAVVCPRQAGCLIAGTLYEGEVDIARPSGTTLDESYVLRLAP